MRPQCRASQPATGGSTAPGILPGSGRESSLPAIESQTPWRRWFFRPHPREYSALLNACQPRPTHPLLAFLELAPVHPFRKARWGQVAFTTPALWKKLGTERKPAMRPLPGIGGSRTLALLYKKEDSHTPSDGAVWVAVNSGQCPPGPR